LVGVITEAVSTFIDESDTELSTSNIEELETLIEWAKKDK